MLFDENLSAALQPIIELTRESIGARSLFALVREVGTKSDRLSLLTAAKSPHAVVPRGELAKPHGILSWPLASKQLLSLSPCEYDGATLGLFIHQISIGSLMVVPWNSENRTGVLVAESGECGAFAEVHAAYVTRVGEILAKMDVVAETVLGDEVILPWRDFEVKARGQIETFGGGNLTLLRLNPRNFVQLEEDHGCAGLVQLWERTMRLVVQIFPPATPVTKLPDGSLLVLVDKMMSHFYENRIHAISQHAGMSSVGMGVAAASTQSAASSGVQFEIYHSSSRGAADSLTFDALLQSLQPRHVVLKGIVNR